MVCQRCVVVTVYVVNLFFQLFGRDCYGEKS